MADDAEQRAGRSPIVRRSFDGHDVTYEFPIAGVTAPYFRLFIRCSDNGDIRLRTGRVPEPIATRRRWKE